MRALGLMGWYSCPKGGQRRGILFGDGRRWKLHCHGRLFTTYMYTQYCITTPARSTPGMQYAKGIMQCKMPPKTITC